MQGIQDFVCIDLETTGLNPKKDRIIEIGAVKIRNGNITDTFEQLINPKQVLEERIEVLTGITSKELEDQPVIRKVLPALQDFLEEDVLVGHRILFDYSFLKRVFTNEKIPFERKGIDTLKLARRFVKESESKRLEALCQYYGIQYRAHRALEDARATVEVYQRLLEEYYEEEEFAPKPLLFKVKKESPITKAQKERLTLLLDKYHLESKYEITSMTRNEASRYMDQILAAYGR